MRERLFWYPELQEEASVTAKNELGGFPFLLFLVWRGRKAGDDRVLIDPFVACQHRVDILLARVGTNTWERGINIWGERLLERFLESPNERVCCFLYLYEQLEKGFVATLQK